jgi:TctA family transporter
MNGTKANKVKGKEAFSILLKAFRVSAATKSKASIAVSVAGFAAAFLPALVSGALKNFSNLVQRSFGSGNAALSALFLSFAILSGLYILQLIHKLAQLLLTSRRSADSFIHQGKDHSSHMYRAL